MKCISILVFTIIFSFASFGQCAPGYIVGPNTVGMGQSITLTDSGNWVYDGGFSYGVSGTWSSSNHAVATIDAATGVVHGVSMGSTVITFTMPSPCWQSTVRVINVNSGATGRHFLCLGDTTTFNNTIGAGTWTSSNPAVANVNPTSGLVTGISAGLAVIYYSTAVGGMPITLSDTISVTNMLPDLGLTASSPHVCVDATDSLTAAFPVSWQILDTDRIRFAGADDQHVVISGGWDSGVARIVAKSLNCLAVKDTFTISVLPLPYVGEVTLTPYSACYTEPIHATISSGLPGVWSVTPTLANVDSFGVVTSTTWDVTFGVYYTVTGANGCVNVAMTSGEFRPGVFLWDIEGPANISIGSTAIYFAPSYSSAPILSTEWSTSDPLIASVSSAGVVEGLSVGTTELVYSATNECSTETIGRLVNIVSPAIGGSCGTFTAYTNDDCSGPVFGVSIPPHSSAYQLKTYFGDGTPALSTAIPANATAALTSFPHTYSISGVYTVKQVIYNGSLPVDSVIYDYEHIYCSDIALSFYRDNNSNCQYDTASDVLNNIPFRVEVLRNGIVTDTVAVTGGMYYPAIYLPGDVYAFRPIGSSTLSFASSCAPGGVIYDTASISGWTFNSRDVAVVCGSAAFDASINAIQRCGRHAAHGVVTLGNSACAPMPATVVVEYDPHYLFYSSTPVPTSVVGNIATWNLSSVSVSDGPVHINYSLELPSISPWLLPGQLINTRYTVTPIAGEGDTTNNVVVRLDTVKSSYDPNHMSVWPAGGILNGTRLHYGIQFENDGNDTAHNIFILDTLSDNLIASSLEIEGASAVMNTTILHAGGHTIVRFEFPDIMLPDSSHHDVCRGMVAYTINSRTGLTDGADILAHAGIYFDDNEVVLTDTAFNHIVIPGLTITASADSICGPSPMHFVANPHSVGTPHFSWFVNSLSFGSDSAGIMLVPAHGNDTVKCVMTTVQDDTVFSISNAIVVREAITPYAGVIAGISSVCAGSSITLVNAVMGGTWTATNAHATASGGIVHGVSAGVDTIIYSVANACFNSSVSHIVTIVPLPDAGSITAALSICPGAAITVSATVPGGTWTLTNSYAAISGTTVAGVSAGADTLIYTVSGTCGTDTARHIITILPALVPSVTETFTPTGDLCGGSTVTFTATALNGGTSPVYHWKKFAVLMGSGSTFSYSPTTGDVITCTMLSSAQCVSADSVTSAGEVLMVYPTVTPSAVIATTSGDSVSYLGQEVTFNSSATYCGPSPVYSWYINGNLIAGATSSTFTTAVTGNDTVYSVINCSIACATASADTSNSIIIYVDYLGIGNEMGKSADVVLYPNPNNGVFEFLIMNANGKNLNYTVVDIAGRTIAGDNVMLSGGDAKLRVDLRDRKPASGQYILRVVTDDGVTVAKFTIAN